MALAKMGRPQAENPKQKTVAVRLTVEEHDDLQKAAAEHGLTITQALKKGIELLYNSWKQ